MESLPDDVLLMVMLYLDEEALFTCRLVCKRLGGLALHPATWRHRHLMPFDNPWFCTALRMAPCVHTLGVTFPTHMMEIRGCNLPYAFTKCAAEAMDVHLSYNGGAEAALAIRQQEALGRLKRVNLDTFDGKSVSSNDDAAMVYLALASTSGLQNLSVHSIPDDISTFGAIQHSSVPPASLRTFDCLLSVALAPFADCILEVHASTLEKVDLFYDESTNYNSITLMGPRLAGMPNLRELACPLLPGLDAQGFTCLKKLTLYVGRRSQSAVLPATKLIRSLAGQLRLVTLEYRHADSGDLVPAGLDLIHALALPARSQLESLTIESFCWGGQVFPQLQPLLSSLPSLAALRHLNVDEAPDELLRGITPYTAPSLRTFKLDEWDGCAHSWMHRNAVRLFITLNPMVHVMVQDFYSSACGNKPCEACALGCHQLLRGTSDVGFFSHDPEKCHASDDHPSGLLWVHITANQCVATQSVFDFA